MGRVSLWAGSCVVAVTLACCGGSDDVTAGADGTAATTSTEGDSSTTSPDPSSTITQPAAPAEASTTTVEPPAGPLPTESSTTTSTPSLRRPDEREVDLAPGAWDGGRTTADGQAVLIAFIGAQPWQDANPCSADYRAEADESADEVAVRFYSASPPHAEGDPNVCTAVGYHRRVTVDLAEPLRGRRLVAMGEARSVFDGAELAELPALPAGWGLVSERMGFAPYGSATPPDAFWSRHVGPPPPTGPCESPAPESGITITEGPPELENREGQIPNGGQYLVRDEMATYWGGGTQVWLEWIEGGRGYSLASGPSCGQEGTASLDRLLEVARSMVPPPPRR